MGTVKSCNTKGQVKTQGIGQLKTYYANVATRVPYDFSMSILGRINITDKLTIQEVLNKDNMVAFFNKLYSS
jgi:hypothetical protein